MAVRVERGLMAAIKENPSSIFLQVRSSDDVRAAAAMDAARMPISDALEPNWISDVTPTPHGPFMTIDAKAVDEASLKVIPEILVRHLEEAGLTDAVLAPARRGGPLVGQEGDRGLAGASRSVMMRLHPPPPPIEVGPLSRMACVPEPWIDAAQAWIDSRGNSGDLMALAGLFEFPLPAESARSFLAEGNATGTRLLAAGSLHDRAWIANVTGSSWMKNMVLGFGGPATTDDDLVEAVAELSDVARGLAPTLAYGVVSIERDLGPVYSSSHPSEWNRFGGPQVGFWTDFLIDEIVLDAYPFQVLCPGHVRRMGSVPNNAEILEFGRIALSIGDPADWLLRPDVEDLKYYECPPMSTFRHDPTIQDRGRSLIGSRLLVTQAEADALRDLRKTTHSVALEPSEIHPLSHWRNRET